MDSWFGARSSVKRMHEMVTSVSAVVRGRLAPRVIIAIQTMLRSKGNSLISIKWRERTGDMNDNAAAPGKLGRFSAGCEFGHPEASMFRGLELM